MSARTSQAAFCAAALPERHTWDGVPTPEGLAPLPTGPAVLLFVDAEQRPVQLLTTQQLRRFATVRLQTPDETPRGRADLAEVVRGVWWRPVTCPFEARWRYYRLARVLYPQALRDLMGFGPTWFLHVDWAQPVPELRVTEQVWMTAGEWLGPWPTRAACQQALDGLRDLFELCRYPDEVRRAPRGQRCAYADMGRCDAPCDGSAAMSRYVARCATAWRFAEGAITSWIEDAQVRMQAAARAQRYESAGQIKQQITFAQRWQKEWTPQVQLATRFNCFLLLPVTRRRAWKPFLFRAGALRDGPVIATRRLGSEGPKWLSESLALNAEEPDPELRRDQTWLVAHLLAHRDAESALQFALPELTVPADLATELARCAAERHPSRTSRKREGAAPHRPDGNSSDNPDFI